MLLSFLKNITKDFLEKGLNGEKHEGKGGPGGVKDGGMYLLSGGGGEPN